MTAGRFRAALAGSLMLLAAVAQGQSRFEEEFDDKDKPWQEIAIQLPPAPNPDNLLPFYTNSAGTQSFAIDAASVTRGADNVVRYTLVSTSDGGARNVSYEGIRCENYERKLYAFGQPDGSWTRSRRDQWERIATNTLQRHHSVLARDYFCQQLTVAGTPEQMVARIRSNRPMTSQFYK